MSGARLFIGLYLFLFINLLFLFHCYGLGRTLSFLPSWRHICVCRLAGGLFCFCLFFCLFFLFNSFCFLLAGPNRQSCGFGSSAGQSHGPAARCPHVHVRATHRRKSQNGRCVFLRTFLYVCMYPFLVFGVSSSSPNTVGGCDGGGRV